jgi:hypothetical protein
MGDINHPQMVVLWHWVYYWAEWLDYYPEVKWHKIASIILLY